MILYQFQYNINMKRNCYTFIKKYIMLKEFVNGGALLRLIYIKM